MSIFMGALGGAGEALANVGGTLLKAEIDRDARAEERAGRVQERSHESDLALQRAKTLEEFKASLANAPLERLGTKAREFAAQDVPVSAPPVRNLTGAGIISTDGKAPDTRGFTGDPDALRRQIQNSTTMSAKEKGEALAQLDAQLSADTRINEGIVAGKMRRRTSEESMAAAVDDAKVNDLPAYAAFEEKIGKPRRDERRVDIQQDREDNRAMAAARAEQRRAEADARRYDVELARLDLQAGTLEATNRKIDAWIENEAAKRENDEARANNPRAANPERLYSIVNAMNATIKNLTESGKGNTAEAKAEWQRQYDTAVRVRDRASALLDSTLTERGAPAAPGPAAPPASAPKPAASATKPPLSSFMRK